MNVSVVINWLSLEQLVEEDASLSLGWIEIQTENYNYSLFEQKLCILIITLCDLLEFLSSNKVNYDWIGVDGGDIYLLTKKKSVLVIQKEDITFQIDYDAFVNAIIDTTNSTIQHLSQVNSAVKGESAFIDLLNCLESLINKKA